MSADPYCRCGLTGCSDANAPAPVVIAPASESLCVVDTADLLDTLAARVLDLRKESA